MSYWPPHIAFLAPGKKWGPPSERSMNVQLGMVGLGRMGQNMVWRLGKAGHEVVVSDLSADAVKATVEKGGGKVSGASDLKDLVGKLKGPRNIWLMVPAGI